MIHKFADGIIKKVSRSQIVALSGITQNIGNIFFGSIALNSLLKDTVSWTLFLWGLIFAFLAWFISLIIVK